MRVRRWLGGSRALAVLVVLVMLVNQTLMGSVALGSAFAEALTQVGRKPNGHFTQSPIPLRQLPNVRRSGRTRGGVWSESRIREVRRFGEQAEWQANLEPQGPEHTLAVDPEPGAAFPWEGSAPSPTGSVNTGNGNKLTKIPLFGWNARGGGLEFTLFHNTQTSYDDELGKGWTWTYDIYINNLSGNPVVHWGDGTSIPYQSSGGSPFQPPAAREFLEGYDTVFLLASTEATPLASGSYTPPAGIYDELVQNPAGTWKVTKKNGTVYNFNAAGFLTSIVDRNGNTISITLNSQNYATRVTDSTGRYYDFTLNSTNEYTAVTDHTGRTWSFAYNSSGQLTTITWPSLGTGTITDQFTYNASHDILTRTDRRGKVWTSTYNSDGSIATETDPLSRTTTFTYASGYTRVSNPLGQYTQDNYNASDELVSQVDEAGFTSSQTRDASRNVTSRVDRRGKTWTFTYNTKGDVLTATDPNGNVDTFTYNTFGQVLTRKNALNQTTTYAYDSNGNLLTVTNPLGKAVTTNTYGSFGLVATSKDALNNTTNYGYDSHGNLTSVVDPTGVTVSISYDTLNRPVTVTDALGNATSTTYDAWGREITKTNPGGSTVNTVYNNVDQPTSVIDELGRTTTYSYNDAGQLSGTANPRGDTETYAYDSAGRRTSVTNGRGKVRTYTYTARGEVVTLTLPDGAVETWAYDGEGNTTAYTNPLNQTILYPFDNAGRQTGIDYPTGADVTFGYDAADRRTSMVDFTGTTTWTFDAAGRNTALSTPEGALSYAYNDADRRTSMTRSGTGTWSYTYDAAGRILTQGNPYSETTTFVYDSLGRESRRTFSSGQYEERSYDNRSRLTGVTLKNASGTVLRSQSYTVDNASQITGHTVAGVATTYGYDLAGQLTSESRSGYSASYTFDGNGNRLTRTVNGTTENYTYDDGDKLLNVKVGTTTVKSFGYDAAGRTRWFATSAGTTNLSYDFESRVTWISGPGFTSEGYAYNGLSARVSLTPSGGSTRWFQRDGATVTSPVLRDTSAVYTPGISERRGSTTTFQHSGLKSQDAQSTISQTVAATKQYDAYGNVVSSSGTWQGPFGYGGAFGYQEDPTGLKLLGHRYYDSSTGRFLTRDPIKDGRNWYAYCDNDPIGGADPEGLQDEGKGKGKGKGKGTGKGKEPPKPDPIVIPIGKGIVIPIIVVQPKPGDEPSVGGGLRGQVGKGKGKTKIELIVVDGKPVLKVEVPIVSKSDIDWSIIIKISEGKGFIGGGIRFE